MKILLNKLKIKNFKGIESLEIDFGGHDCIIRGVNGSGKTSIIDAWLFLATGKDSLGNSDAAAFKPRDKDMNEIHFLETVVEAELGIDGKSHTFKKMLKENWVKKRGQEEQEYSGNTAEYWIDEVPTSSTEYKKYIDGLIPEEIFKMVTNSEYFMSLKWDKRREMLFKIAGAPSDTEIMQDGTEYSGLAELLNGRTVDQMKKVCKDRINGYKKDIDEVSPRIDEKRRELKVCDIDYKPLEIEAARLTAAISTIEKELYDIQESFSAYRKQQRDLLDLKQRRDDAVSHIKKAASQNRVDALDKIDTIKRQILHEEGMIRITEATMPINELKVKETERKVYDLREEWTKVNESQFEEKYFEGIPENSFVCPTCGQNLPLDQKEAIILEASERFKKRQEKDRADFETGKATQLHNITAEGQANKKQLETFRAIVADDKAKIEAAEKAIEELKAKLPELEAQTAVQDAEADATDEPHIKDLDRQIAALEVSVKEPEDSKSAALLEKKQGYEKELREVNSKLDGRKTVDGIKARIAELETDHKTKAQDKANEERTLFLLEKFSTFKCNLLSDKVNAMFDRIKWKLFDIQINGGISECCDCTVNGQVYGMGLNNAACINAGIEIANVISLYYGVSVALFIDNAEAVNSLYPIQTQRIVLYVTEDETLKIEVLK